MYTTPKKCVPPSSPKSPSWIVEREAIRLFGDRKTRAILAIYHARRSARKAEFFVHPDIAKRWDLSPPDLNWALDRLDGKLVETLDSKNGRFRIIRLLPQFEEATASTGSGSKRPDSLLFPDEEPVEIDHEEVMARVTKTMHRHHSPTGLE